MKKFFYVGLLCWNSIASPQELPSKTQQEFEDLAEKTGEEIEDDDQLLQQVEFFRKHPLNLNIATREDLQQFRLLTAVQIENFLNYRNLLGKLISLYELQAVPGWDIGTIRRMYPFIYVGPAIDIKENFLSRFKAEHSILLRWSRVLEKSTGYIQDTGNRYLGDPNHLFFRYRYQYKDLLYFGVVGDKDAGEQFSGSHSKGFDFYSVHFFVKKLGIIKALALGDFAVNLGQGLIQWQSSGFIKSAEAMAVKRQSAVLTPYRTAGEFSFYRGMGITLQKRRLELTGFISRKRLSGNIDDSSGSFSSFRTSGYNRTVSEISSRNRITELATGGSVSYKKHAFNIALNTVYHVFNLSLKKENAPYNNLAIAGSRLFNASVDHSYTYHNLHIFGEVAVDKNSNTAMLEGIIISVDRKVDVSFLYRDINKAYQSLYARAFTENSTPANERGIYAGLTLRPAYGWTINAYTDLFQFPWLRYRMDAPAGGADYLLNIHYQPSKQTELFFRWRSENKPVNISTEQNTRYPNAEVRKSLRIHFSSQLTPQVLFRARMEMVWVGNGAGKEEGFLGYAETIRQLGEKFKTGLRLQYVETGGYDSRIYVYESDVLYGFSIPAFYDKGIRYYINMSYQFKKKVNANLRFARWVAADRGETGSGLDLIGINHKSEVKMQFLVVL